MKKTLSLLFLILNMTHLYGGSKDALFKLEIGNIFATFGGKASPIGKEDVLFTSMRAGILLDRNQFIILGKDTAVSTVSNISTLSKSPAPASLFITNEYLEYEYVLDFGFFVDIGVSVSAGAYIIGNGVDGSGTFLASEPQIKLIFNVTPNIKLQLGYGQRFSTVTDTDIAALGITKAEVDTSIYSMTVDIGGF